VVDSSQPAMLNVNMHLATVTMISMSSLEWDMEMLCHWISAEWYKLSHGVHTYIIPHFGERSCRICRLGPISQLTV
jgi:hypothetical protein